MNTLVEIEIRRIESETENFKHLFIISLKQKITNDHDRVDSWAYVK